MIYKDKEVGLAVYQKLEGDGPEWVVRVTPEGSFPCLFQSHSRESVLQVAQDTLEQAHRSYKIELARKQERARKAQARRHKKEQNV